MTITIVEGRRAGLTLPAAMVLSQLSFWHPKAKARHGEKTWWAKTHTEISALSGVSVHQVRRGLTELKKRGLVETTQQRFAGATVMFLRPLVTLLGQPSEGVVAHGCEATGGVVAHGCATPTTEKPSYREPSKKAGVHAHATDNDGVDEEDPGETCMIAPKPRAKTVAEVLMSSPKILKNPPAVSIADRWRDVVIEVHGGYFVPLTMKQRGQLKHLGKVCPPGRAADIVEHALRNWLEFVKAAEDDAGAYNTPAKPSIAFLVKYAAVAVQLSAPQPIPIGFQPKPKPQVEVKLTAKPPAPGSEKATLEEVLAIMADPAGSSG